MFNYVQKKIGLHRGKLRLWLEGRNVLRSAFNPGDKYTWRMDPERKLVSLHVERATELLSQEEGSRTVSKKEGKNGVQPIIDFEEPEALALFEGCDQVRVSFQNGVIYILPVAGELRKVERFARLTSKLEKGEPLLVGSVSHGGGILSHALHSGLAEAGIPTQLAFANDIREELLEHAAGANSSWTESTSMLALPLQELAFDEYALKQLPVVDILEGGLPCSGASVAGRAKRGLAIPEDHPEVGHLVVAFLALIAKVNPAVVVFENVPQYQNSASMSIMRTQLQNLRYDLQERLLDGGDWGVLEHRQRMVMVAVTPGITLDLAQLLPTGPASYTLADILDDIKEDDPRWSRMEGLKAKEIRDKEAGKSFAMQLFDTAATKVGTITKGYAKVRSTDPKLKHPTDPDLLRQFTVAEHARLKGIPPELVAGITSQTLGHEILGQSVIYTPFQAVGVLLGKALQTVVPRSLAVSLA